MKLAGEGQKRSRTSQAISFAIHTAIVAALAYHPAARILKPEASLRGNGGGGVTTTILVAPGSSVLQTKKVEPDQERDRTLRLQAARKKKAAQTVQQAAVPSQSLKPGMPGYMLGPLSSGFVNDHDVRVALPTVAPDPPIIRSKLPDWIRGDVIVEVTISDTGEVTETAVLQHVGFGLEDIIVTTLKQWHFIPAKVDGIAVASKQDVHFHFPS